MQRIFLIARGSVQGVGFRAFVMGHALQLGVSGYVRNLPDGSVEIVAEGTPEQLEELCRRVRVQERFGISVEQLEERGRKEISKPGFSSFSIAY
ncbi:MAG: acylphosphatase [Candidatus Micrarchaeota archaeon]|nr:acylphosphatase [Candidatus Micrarchaeota archaeon]